MVHFVSLDFAVEMQAVFLNRVNQRGAKPVGLLGSTSFFDNTGNSKKVCEAIGREVSRRSSYILCTGGLSGVAETGAL